MVQLQRLDMNFARFDFRSAVPVACSNIIFNFANGHFEQSILFAIGFKAHHVTFLDLICIHKLKVKLFDLAKVIKKAFPQIIHNVESYLTDTGCGTLFQKKSKKITKMFGTSKTIAIFAAVHAKNCICTYGFVAFFMFQIQCFTAIIRLSTLLVTTTHKLVTVLGGIRAVAFSLFINYLFFHSMPRTNENASEKKSSTLASASDGTTSVSIEAFNTEKNAKNEAYYFILSHGLYKHFVEFCRSYHSSSPNRDCVNCLISKI